MTNEEILAFRKKEDAFAATPIGAAFIKFKNASATAWVRDTEDTFTERNRVATKEAFEKMYAAEHELRALIEGRL